MHITGEYSWHGKLNLMSLSISRGLLLKMQCNVWAVSCLCALVARVNEREQCDLPQKPGSI